MHLKSSQDNGILIITVEAERIDASSAIHLKDQFREAVNDHDARVVMDLEKVGFMDSSGLGAMVASLKMLGGRALELTNLSPAVEKVFKLTRMDRVFTLHETLETALDAQNDVSAA